VVPVHVDRELGVPVQLVDLLEPGRADEPVVAELADGEEEASPPRDFSRIRSSQAVASSIAIGQR
jgi:hypothetical protein